MFKSIVTLLCVVFFSTTMSAADFYWVGGTGSWSDINHWRTSSGGSAMPAVVPGPLDNVFFDVNSGFTNSSKIVYLNVDANCHNITFKGTIVPVTFKENGVRTLSIYGSSEWQVGMPAIEIRNIVYKNTNEKKTIKSNGVLMGSESLNSEIIFEEQDTISLLDDLEVKYKLILNKGTFVTNNFTVKIWGSLLATSHINKMNINLGSSQIIFTGSFGGFLSYGREVTLDAGTSHIIFDNGGSFNGIQGRSGQVFYDVTFKKGSLSNGAAPIACEGGNSTTTFHNVNFIDVDGEIKGNNSFNQLIFSSNRNYSLEESKRQSITELFSFNTQVCSGWGTLTSSEKNKRAIITTASNTTVAVSGVIMNDILGNGVTSFVANNSIDNGNNIGWAFPNPTKNVLYWVGGSGNWNDKSHWSNTSGGTGGFCTPGPVDDVFFDGGSGFSTGNNTITITDKSYVKNIVFKGNVTPPLLTQQGSQELNIYGSSEWQKDMPSINIRTVYYRSTNEDKTITSNGVSIGAPNLFGEVHIQEKKSISLKDDLYVGMKLYHDEGTFNTNNHNVYLSQGYSTYSSSSYRIINLGSSNIYVINEGFETSGENVFINAGTSKIQFSKTNTYAKIKARPGHVFYDVIFENKNNTNNNELITGGNSVNSLKFHNVSIASSGTIKGDNEFNQLLLSKGNSNVFEGNSKQVIKDIFTFETNDCEGWGSLLSLNVGQAVTLSVVPTTQVNVSGAILSDMIIEGGSNYNTKKLIDGGNNKGWVFTPISGQSLYWVGGSGNWNDITHWSQTSGGVGGYCLPGAGDDVFFDAKSGFTVNNSTITLNSTAFVRDITFNNSIVSPILKEDGSQTMNIYGSSIWQKDMESIKISVIKYKDTGRKKTITSNGVAFFGGIDSPTGTLYLEETTEISLVDEINITGDITLVSGTFDTKSKKVDILGSLQIWNNNGQQILRLGSSTITFKGQSSRISADSYGLILDAGTSHIDFSNSRNSSGIVARAGTRFYDVTYNNTNTKDDLRFIEGGYGKPIYFNKVVIKGNAIFRGNNNFEQLFLGAGKTYTFNKDVTQTINDFIISGTPCEVTTIKSSEGGSRAIINVTGGDTTFNFVNIVDINASGLKLHFGDKSSNNGNNLNMDFDVYNPGAFNGFGQDIDCFPIDSSVPSSSLLKTDGFYGNELTTYKWYKLNDTNYNSNTVIGTNSAIDLMVFGVGRYKVEVNYSNGEQSLCQIVNEVLVKNIIDVPIAKREQSFCLEDKKMLNDIVLTGTNVQWYDSGIGGAILPMNTQLVDGRIYYASQTIGTCESIRIGIKVNVKRCVSSMMINPSVRLRVK